jgi:hypothetical protein
MFTLGVIRNKARCFIRVYVLADFCSSGNTMGICPKTILAKNVNFIGFFHVNLGNSFIGSSAGLIAIVFVSV